MTYFYPGLRFFAGRSDRYEAGCVVKNNNIIYNGVKRASCAVGSSFKHIASNISEEFIS